MGFIIQDECGLRQLRLDTDGPGPGERQRWRGGELGSRFVGTWMCRDEVPKSPFAASAQKIGREGLHIMTESMHLVHEGCKSGHFTVLGADDDLWKALAIARHGATGRAGVLLSPTPEHHEPV